ncbi:cytochrome P450/oxidoreductase [Streptomyces sp. NPDC050625]|uniref:cytochrome P450/oxidoreductase n=1 Tax=Streptomyces sp. NPDC050625 TaxID=3154629 RepID=UPI00342300E9
MIQQHETAKCPVAGVVSTGHATSNGCPVGVRALEFDPFEDGYQQDPATYVAWARAEEPVFFSPRLGYWVVTRYDDVQAVFRDNETFSPSIALEKITATGDEANAVLASYGYAMDRTLVNEDEPAHMPRRRLLMEPFTPEHLAVHEPMVRRLTREYVDRFIDDGQADLVDQMLWEVPLTVALHFLGVPEEDMDTLRRYSIAHTVNTWGRPTPGQQVEVAHAVGNFWEFSGKVVEKLRQDPSGPGWMPYSIRQQREFPDVVTDSYLHSMMMAGIVAAHETTANAAANAIKTLLENRSVWQELSADPTLIPNAVEECLRFNGSVAAWRRIATRDATVGGVDIPAGSKVLIMMSSANRDLRNFEDPDFFDIRREAASSHLTFGYGSHQCMGKNLARMELQIFLEELTRRLPHVELAEQPFSYVPNTSFRGPEHLLVRWDPARNPERANPEILQAATPVRIGQPSARTVTRSAIVATRTELTDRIVHFRLVSPDGSALPAWTPGAHIDVECGETGTSRQYSLCGDPQERHSWEIAVLRDDEGRGGSAWMHEHATLGRQVHLRGPRNHFRLDEAAGRYVFIAGGIGITPIRAMAHDAARRGADYELHYLGRNRSSMAFLEELKDFHGDHLRLWISDEGTRADLRTLLSHVQEGTQFYCCGPQRMLDELTGLAAGLPADSVHIEHFVSTLGELDPTAEHAFDVELRSSGLTIRVNADQTVLESLRAANIDIPSDCEEGLCGTCQVGVVEGEIDHRDVVLTRSERAAGTTMMTCCSRACGDRLTLAL